MSSEDLEIASKLFEKIDKMSEDTHGIRLELRIQNEKLNSLIHSVQNEVLDLKKKYGINSERISTLETLTVRANGWWDSAKLAWLVIASSLGFFIKEVIDWIKVH